jgi:hypothetical protein
MSVAVLPGQPWVGRRRQPQRHLERLHRLLDANYAITVDPWHAAFDTILHLDEVTPSRLLADSG